MSDLPHPVMNGGGSSPAPAPVEDKEKTTVATSSVSASATASIPATYKSSASVLKAREKARAAQPTSAPPGVSVTLFELDTQRGPKKFEAMDEAQARRLAAIFGLDVKTVKKLETRELSPKEAASKISKAQQQGTRQAAEAFITYGGAFEGAAGERYFGQSVVPPPAGSVPVVTDEGVIFLPPEMAQELRSLPAYKEAKGQDSARLSQVYVSWANARRQLDLFLDQYVKVPLKESLSNLFFLPGVASAEEAQYIPLIPVTEEELQIIADQEAKGQCIGAMKAFYTVKTYKVTLKDGSVVYAEALGIDSAKKKATAAGYNVGWATKVTEPAGGWEREEFVNVSELVDSKGETKARDLLESTGVKDIDTVIDRAGQNEALTEFQTKVTSGEIIALPDDTFITKEEFDKQLAGTQQILMEGGFVALEAATEVIYEKKGKSSERFPRYITREGYGNLNVIDRAMYSPAPGYGPRVAAELGTLFIPPLKATLPEYTMADVSATDWLLAGANVALLATAFAPGTLTGTAAATTATVGKGAQVVRGVQVAASGTISGVVAHGTVKHWDELTHTQRGIGVGIAVLCAIPILTTVARNVKITASPSIPTVKGNVVTWKGLSVAGHPVIGKSGGKWILGTRNLTIPEARLILDGYHPQMALETKVFVNRTALTRAGFTKTQINYLENTLKARKLFAGKTSPWLDKNVLVEPTERLTSNEISIVMRRIAEKPGQVKNAKFLYGSPTIKAQAAPELRNWRSIHDWDISVTGSQANVEAFTQSLLKALKAKGGGVYRISPKSNTLIEKYINGKWTHIADIHPYNISGASIPTSKLDATGAYSYGKMVSEPAVTINYPGVGKLHIMRLSESGVRKADTILRVRQTPQGTAFRPPARGIAQPGVPKDAADFYIILRTFKGEVAAENWLKSWARAMGYTDAQLVKVLPKVRTAMLEVAAQTPSDIIGYEFVPAKSVVVSTGASPSIVIHIPSSLGASVSPSLARAISQPVYPYKQAQLPSVPIQVSLASQSVASQFGKTQPPPSAGLYAPSYPSLYLRPSPSPYLRISPSLYSSPSPYLSPSPSPSLGISPSLSLIPSSSLVLSPSLYPSPYPYPSSSPGLKPRPIWLSGVREAEKEKQGRIVVRAKFDGRDYEGAVNYAIESANRKITGTRVSETFSDLEPATYRLKYISGAPEGTIDYKIHPGESKALSPAGTITFTIAFSTKPITVAVTETRPGLVVKLPVAKGLSGVMGDAETTQTIAGVKQEVPITSTEKKVVGTRVRTLRDYTPEKHGSHSTYVSRSTEPLELEELPMEGFMALKSPKIDEALWKRLGRQSEGIELLGEPEETLLPFGLKDTRPVERRIKLAQSPDAEHPVTAKLSKKAARKLLGWDTRTYLGHKLPEPQLGGEL